MQDQEEGTKVPIVCMLANFKITLADTLRSLSSIEKWNQGFLNSNQEVSGSYLPSRVPPDMLA
jgi:hypothetical protein